MYFDDLDLNLLTPVNNNYSNIFGEKSEETITKIKEMNEGIKNEERKTEEIIKKEVGKTDEIIKKEVEKTEEIIKKIDETTEEIIKKIKGTTEEIIKKIEEIKEEHNKSRKIKYNIKKSKFKLKNKYIHIYTRKEKGELIDRYKKKKINRKLNKIKNERKSYYECRRKFAQNRPRVGGRFISTKNL